jgi:hypothetical protein
VVRRTFWLIKVVLTWKKFEKRWSRSFVDAAILKIFPDSCVKRLWSSPTPHFPNFIIFQHNSTFNTHTTSETSGVLLERFQPYIQRLTRGTCEGIMRPERMLITHNHLVSMLRMNGAIPLLPLMLSCRAPGSLPFKFTSSFEDVATWRTRFKAW